MISLKTQKILLIVALVSYSLVIVMKLAEAAKRGIIIADIVDVVVDIGILVLLTVGYYMAKKYQKAKEADSANK